MGFTCEEIYSFLFVFEQLSLLFS